MRKLASIRKISKIKDHSNADALELAIVDGWQCVVKKGEFKAGDIVVYFEVDSVLPLREEFEFLRKSCYVKREWIEGFRLKTIKLRGEISQGLVLHYDMFPEVVAKLNETSHSQEGGIDVTEVLGVVKWDPPVPAQLAGQVKGMFPSFIPKTDQERVQNLAEVLQTFEDKFEITMKLDGSSCTMYHKDGETGVCSRNFELKVADENKDNTFVKTFVESGMRDWLSANGLNIAVQGEMMGPGIQGNRENLDEHKFFVFDIFDIDVQEYLKPNLRIELWKRMVEDGVKVDHVPVLDITKIPNSVDELLKMAEGPSINHSVREGIVFKRCDGKLSFKAISNKYLLQEK